MCPQIAALLTLENIDGQSLSQHIPGIRGTESETACGTKAIPKSAVSQHEDQSFSDFHVNVTGQVQFSFYRISPPLSDSCLTTFVPLFRRREQTAVGQLLRVSPVRIDLP
jgi:hypothetical protein